ncbi:glycosyl hydrolase family 28-related protein [Pararhodobacter sp.]|uniref:glycosyl hydrolase family 28-related protein n=1 Tax=Pararhodobacter sp. TaxID=2127056 RepID=UPI002FDEC4F1
MNKAVTEGLILMPPPFEDGLDVWSSGNGTPGSPTYAGAANAAFVPSDPDFGGCLELIKNDATQRLRWMGQVPVLPGLYVRVTARIKVLSGALPAVRIAGFAANSGGGAVAGVTTQGPSVALDQFGKVFTISAIIGTGPRGGVNMNWAGVAYGYLGLDLTGPNGGVVRIDDLQIEDVTAFYLRDMMDWVDVRDHGAVGDGARDDRPAFVAAANEAAQKGCSLLVPEGVFFIGATLTIEVPVRFQGRLVMAESSRLQLTKSYDFPTYAAAFGDDDLGFRKGVQALFHFTEHASFDLRGRRVQINAPVDVSALSGLTAYAQRRQICNGQIDVVTGPAWNTQVVTSQASYSTGQATRLSNVTNIANVPPGARVSGTGVGREVYVRSRNVSAGTLTLSQPLHGGSGTQSYTFTKFQHVLDLSGFATLQRFEVDQIEFLCKGAASTISLPTEGAIFTATSCTFNSPRDKAITSTGGGCQGMLVDNCQFLSSEMALPAQNRSSIAINANANDVKLRNNRVVRFAHFAVLGGTGNLIMGNHFFQGDSEQNAPRTAGLVFTRVNLLSTVTGNYVDNCFIELTNEHTANPAWSGQFSFGGLTVTGNFFLCSNVGTGFRFFVVKPYGPGHFLQGLQVSGNVFRTINGGIERAEGVDTTHAALDFARFRNVIWENNAYNGITNTAESPLVQRHDQNTASSNWTISTGNRLPFQGWARTVQSFVMEGAPNGPGNEVRTGMPYANIQQGTNRDQVRLTWPSATRGRVVMTIRVDNPL